MLESLYNQYIATSIAGIMVVLKEGSVFMDGEEKSGDQMVMELKKRWCSCGRQNRQMADNMPLCAVATQLRKRP